MKVEIWSDVMCPFCYIGKRNFEAALAQFPGTEILQVLQTAYAEWKKDNSGLFQIAQGATCTPGNECTY